jgi:hypothetical protein
MDPLHVPISERSEIIILPTGILTNITLHTYVQYLNLFPPSYTRGHEAASPLHLVLVRTTACDKKTISAHKRKNKKTPHTSRRHRERTELDGPPLPFALALLRAHTPAH